MEAETLVIKDIFGDELKPGDVFIYGPGTIHSTLKVGVIIKLISDHNHGKKTLAAPHVQVKFTDSTVFAFIKLDIFQTRAAAFDLLFRINHPLAQAAFKMVENYKEQGIIPK